MSLAHKRKYYFVRPDEDMRVLWNPGNYIAKYAALVLKNYIPYNDSVGGTPSEFCRLDDDEDDMKGYQAWRKCLEEILFAFEFFADEYNQLWMADEETKHRVRHGLELFAKYFDHLWT